MVFNMALPARFEAPTDNIAFGFKILTADIPRPAKPDTDALYLPLGEGELGSIVVSSYRPQTTERDAIWLCVGAASPLFSIGNPSAGGGLPMEWTLPITGVYYPDNSAGYYSWEPVSPLFLYENGSWKELTQ